MPNVGTDTTESPKRAPRKRAVRRVVSSASTPVRKPRATSRASSTTTRTSTTRTTATARKAPSTISEAGVIKKSPKKYIILGIGLAVFITAAWIGSSDSGAIDVSAKITEKNQRDSDNLTNNDNDDSNNGEVVVPVQNVPAAALNLRGRGVGTANVSAQPEPGAEEIATTTDEISTSTESGTEGTPEGETSPESDVSPQEEPTETPQ